ncbi:N-acetylmuramoyl-L-alanine amidase [[Clostridium] ultunense Esp]|nr:N-acetylmuramoyl-L-alanine amidase [[Clostridium] ultunense Esp]
MTKKKFILLMCLILSLFGSGTYAAAEKATPVPIKVVIDPGHGGKDPGAIGVNGLREKDVNLDISYRLRDLLIAQGYRVVMTREDDRLLVDYSRSTDQDLDLQARVDVAKRENADLFISIHANFYPYGNNVQGTMVLYFDPANYSSVYKPSAEMIQWAPESKRLAQLVLQSVTSEVGTKNMGIIPRNVYVVRMGTVPSILVETAFLSNWEDAQNLADPGFRQRMAEAIRDGIIAYRPYRYVDIVNHWAKEEISALSLEGIVQGYRDGKFHPDQQLTRAELVALLDRATGFDGLASVNPIFSFPDVTPDFWGYDAIMKAGEKGVIQGYPDGGFHPNDPVTREEMSAIIYRYFIAGKEGNDPSKTPPAETAPSVSDDVYQKNLSTSQPAPDKSSASTVTISALAFQDIPSSSWALEAIQSLYEAGIVEGMRPGFFGFGRPVTRAEAATILYRILQENQS